MDRWSMRAAKGSTLTYLGTEDVDGTDAHKIKVAQKDGDTLTVFLDPDYFLTIRTRYQHTVRGADTQIGDRLRQLREGQRRAHPVLVRGRIPERAAIAEDRARQGRDERAGRRRAVRLPGGAAQE